MASTLNTVIDYVTDARSQMQDTVQPYRYDDSSLIVALNVTLLEARRLRADLFIFAVGDGSVPVFQTPVDSSPVVLEAPFRLAILYGMIGFALQRDEEDIQDARAAYFLGVFNDMLLGVRPQLPPRNQDRTPA